MKRKIILTIVFLFVIHLITLGQKTYISKVQDGSFVQITLITEGNNVIVKRESTRGNDNIGSRVYNLTDLDFNDEHQISFPSEGKYWWIPFEENDKLTLFKANSNWCYECSVDGGCYNGTCDWLPVGGGCFQCKCTTGSTSNCFVTRCPCDSRRLKISGGGIIINAENVSFR